jgi:hypothetical protein
VVALAVGAALFGIATAVQASIPDASGVIHSCYNNSLAHGNPTGALRVIDTTKANGNCASWETPLNWNQRGTTGQRGVTGPTGPPGSGTATTVTAAESAAIPLTAALTGTDLATLDLPAGSFVIFARAVYSPVGSVANFIAECKLTAGTDTDPANGARILFGTHNGDLADASAITMNVLHTFASPGSATLNCGTSLAQPSQVQDVRITAIQVGAIS